MIRDIVTRGFGLGDGTKYIPTQGFIAGEAPPPAIPTGIWSETTRPVIWGRNMSVLVKKPGESLVYAFDFNTHAAIRAGDTLTTVTSVIPTLQTPGTAVALTLGSASISGTRVALSIGGGNDGEEYAVEFKVGTIGSQILVGLGILDIREDP